MKQSTDRVILEIKTSRTSEETPEAMVQFLSSLSGLRTRFYLLWRRGVPLSMEIAVLGQTIHFYLSMPPQYQSFVESQLISQYPKTLITKVKDYLPEVMSPKPSLICGQLKLATSFLYPLRTFSDFKDVDPMSSLLGVLSKAQPGDRIALQVLLVPVGGAWQGKGMKATNSKKTDSEGKVIPNPYAKYIAEKISFSGFKAAIRIAVNTGDRVRSQQYLFEVANSFSSFTNPSGNSFMMKKGVLWQRSRLPNAIEKRSKRYMPRTQVLNVQELATVFHFPTMKLASIHNISWHKTILSEAPESLPIAEGLSDEEKQDINFFASTQFKNRQMSFGIKAKDRRRHVYVIGKTGAGKSTLIANMAIDDMRKKRGFAVIDPHGDLCDILLSYVPSYRVNDVIYLDPADTKHAFSLNPLEVQTPAQKELVVSGIVAIFHKLYGNSWGPRLEYVLRNAILSVIDLPDATLLMVPDMLVNDEFRAKALEKIKDPVLISFWKNEFEKMPPKLMSETISPILNKVGQFISSQTIRNIIKNPKSTIDLEKAMNEGKIILLNLSQGRLGEDNAALLGAMTITKLQLAAMNRVNQKEEDRRDFYLYVDEFQNFATSSFIKILSEARKYRLNLILANQYIAQIPEDVRAAIFGNAGTMLSFIIGAQDSSYMAKEFGERFKEEDLLALGNFQAIIKLAIDNITTAPFLCYTLPLPNSVTQNKEKVKRSSQERYTKQVK